MVTQAPKRSAVFAAVAFTLSCIGLIIFVWTQFGGSIPFAPEGYRVQALFSETGLLVPNADVRISGVNVGRVAKVQAEGLDSLVTLDIDHGFAPIPRDTHAILREKTLLGEAYIDLSAGSKSSGTIPDGGRIPSSQVVRSQQLDEVLSAFNTRTQHNLQRLLIGTGEALAGRGETLNDAIGNLDPLTQELGAVVGVLNDQSGNLRSLLSNGATVLQTLGDRGSELQSLITSGNAVFSATASEDTGLTDTVDGLPPFLTQLRGTLRTLNTTLGIARPSLQALRPAAPLLTPALRQLSAITRPALSILHASRPLLADAKVALPAIGSFATAFKPGVDALLPAAQQVVPVIDYANVDRVNIVAAMANLAAGLQASSSANTPTGSAGYLRALISLGRDSVFGASTREPTDRNNTYYAPGELADIVSGGLKAGNCDNTGNVSQVPLPFTNVACVVQDAFHWGNGVPTGYYPHLSAAAR